MIKFLQMLVLIMNIDEDAKIQRNKVTILRSHIWRVAVLGSGPRGRIQSRACQGIPTIQ